MDIVLTPALKPVPTSRSVNSSPAPSMADLEEKLSAAECRRVAMESLRAQNLSSKLAKVEQVKMKKEELVTEKSLKTKAELETKLKTGEEKRMALLSETKEKLSDHLAKVERAQKELEVQTEAARLSVEFALHAKMMKAEENKDEKMEELMRKIKEHEEYVSKVRVNQEKKLKPYFEELEINLKEKLAIASKRREEHVAKVVEASKEEDIKVEEASARRGEQEAAMQAKTEAELKERMEKATERKAMAEDVVKFKQAEREKKAELVRLNKSKLRDEGSGDTVPESA